MYSMELEIPASVIAAATEKTVNGTAYDVITVTFESAVSGEESARVCSYLYSEAFQNYQAYFVDCGDYQPSTVSDGDYLGVYNSVTEQVYGTDSVTGKSWGIVDTFNKTWSESAATYDAAKGIFTNSTWAYEYLTYTDGLNNDKTVTFRYTRDQAPTYTPTMKYDFELPAGDYIVEVYFNNIWGNSQNVKVTADGTVVIAQAEANKVLQTEVIAFSGGTFNLTFTATTSDCVCLSYIRILFA